MRRELMGGGDVDGRNSRLEEAAAAEAVRWLAAGLERPARLWAVRARVAVARVWRY